MRILFILSGEIWTWLISRCIVFGPNVKGICWYPNMHADTWYRLTPLPYQIPFKLFPYISIVIATLAIPILYLDDNTIHTLAICTLVSEHTFLPIFVAHKHSEALITTWAALNTATKILLLYMLYHHEYILATVSTVFQTVLMLWFFFTQLYIVIKQPIQKQQPPIQERHQRVITV